MDNDGDGLRDEDPVYTGANDTANSCSIIDNDGDGLFDEDPIDGIDNDGDGLIDEDDPDNDGDGIVDEDGACEDAVVFCFEAVFDISGLGIEGPGDGVVPSAADLRIDLLVTFKAGGKRGGTCSADVDCDGVLEDGKGGNPDEGEGQVRTIQQRLRFDPAACDPVCECVTLTDLGAFADDPACAEVLSTTLDEVICATGFEGTETVRDITGTVTCQPNCPPPPGEQGLYGITLSTDSLFRIDTTSGAGNLIGPLNMGFNILTVGADFACDGTLWVFSSIGNGQHLLYTVDITNGQSTPVLIYNTSGLPTVVGFEFDIDESTMLWRANRFLHRLELDSTLTLITNSLPVNSVRLTVNPDTCSDFFSEASGFLQIIASDGSVVTTVGPTLNSISSLASAPDGTLFAHAAGILYTVSKITGAALPVGPIGASTPGMAFGPLEVTCTPSCPFCEGCSSTVTNTAELTCEDDSLIEGSPASASFEVNCAGGDGHGEDFCRQTQGGWGQDSCNPGPDPCAGGNVGCFRDCHFDDLFPSGLVVGDPDGPDADGSYAILLTSSAAVAEYLPAGGMPAALTADQTDPETTSSGVFGGQLVAATLNVAVDDGGLGRDGASQPCPVGTLGTLL